ncbi:MarR family transcriptional regulator [Heliobacterium chlorum]|uniref:MarR family transcriptional regulator n=1 Tax=Heliobacterium chlorum TaxID=2698 RepID=A0ABR7T5Y1_HELCL|nr:MarR family transcriptional regulator [Heliobacterium chlorum]MBC9786183.1 MarR family transcriptional regulator [Heliobacterium chlorum]
MDRDELLKLDNQLCFTIYACSREIIRIYRPFLAELGLTYTQYVVLLVLWEKDDITLKELGEHLYLDSGTLTPLLKKMEAAGLLFRQRSHDDERHIFIRLTEQGKELKNAAYETLQKAFCNMPISMEEASSIREQLKSLLHRLPSVRG